MFKLVCVVVLLVAVASANEIHFEDCGHHEVTKLDASQCNGEEVCVIHKGKPLKFDAEMIANQNSTKMSVKLIATVDGLTIPVPGADKDGCKYIKCPLIKGQKYNFQYALTVPKILPDIKAEVTAQLIGDHGILACIKVI